MLLRLPIYMAAALSIFMYIYVHVHVGIYLPPPFTVTGAIRREKAPQPVMYSCAIFWSEIWEFGMSLRDAEPSGGGGNP